MTLLVTGGTGTVGGPAVAALRAAGHEPRILSRRDGPGHLVGDLRSGAGLPEALDGVETVLHLATNRWSDAAGTRRLLEASASAGVRHFVYLSIVGIDRVPYAYYRSKLACEQLIASSGLAYTILRATQFHEFVAGFLRAQRRLPRIVVPDIPVQPVDTEAVAARLVSLAEAAPAGRVGDLGGPETLPLAAAARQWLDAHGDTRGVGEWHLPGRLAAAFRAGHHTTGTPGPGRTFATWAASTTR